MQTSGQRPLEEQETHLTEAVMQRGLRVQALAELETQMTESVEGSGKVKKKAQKALEELLAKKVSRRHRLERQETQPMKLQKRRRRFLVVLAALLLCLTCLGIFIGPPLVRSLSSPAAPSTSALQHVLNPATTVSNSTVVSSVANLFMHKMQQKDWPGLWALLASDAQSLWQGEQEFQHFEQTKFGAITLQSYNLGQTVVNTPWLDPDTTRVYSSAAVIRVSLQATAPDGLLTVPSRQALSRGLFNGTLLALVQRGPTWQIMLAGPADLDAPVLVPAKPPVSHLIIPIYMYHHVSSVPTHNQFDFNLTVTTADFNAQLTWMQKQGYHAITMTELFDTFYYGKALPRKPMMLTFDDGYTDVYTYALPALLAHHYRGVFYIITGMIGGNYVTWRQVRDLDRSGMQIASHTIHHINIGEPPVGTTTQSELLKSKARLEDLLKKPIQFFCYPTGEPFHHDTLYEQKIVLQDLFNDGYLSATLDPAEFNSALQNSALPYELPRIRVSGGEDLAEFEGILSATLQADQERLKALK
jgi:peptidoglycan/xylan/chitin deacetylase (PgdA/CDA1 family)